MPRNNALDLILRLACDLPTMGGRWRRCVFCSVALTLDGMARSLRVKICRLKDMSDANAMQMPPLPKCTDIVHTIHASAPDQVLSRSPAPKSLAPTDSDGLLNSICLIAQPSLSFTQSFFSPKTAVLALLMPSIRYF